MYTLAIVIGPTSAHWGKLTRISYLSNIWLHYS